MVNTTRRATGGVDGASHAMNVFMATTSLSAATLYVRIEDNVIGNASTDGSGSSFGNGIRVNFNGNGQGRALVDNDDIFETPQRRDMEVIGRNGTGQLDITITNNTVDHTNAAFNPGTSDSELAGIFVQSNVVGVSGYTVRTDVRGNTVPAGVADGELLPSTCSPSRDGVMVSSGPDGPRRAGPLDS
jgi:hypothetical protein